jgi:hypothetical protein
MTSEIKVNKSLKDAIKQIDNMENPNNDFMQPSYYQKFGNAKTIDEMVPRALVKTVYIKLFYQ